MLNVKLAWRGKCVADNQGNATLCHQYVLANFEPLLKNHKIRMGVNNDFGGKGVSSMCCVGRPLVPMEFQADLLNHQTYWSGGLYHLTIQTSDCRAKPLVRSNDLEYTLFESTGIDGGADSLQAMPPGGWHVEPVVKTRIFERKLRVESDGYLGKLLLIDEEQPGQLVVNKETGLRVRGRRCALDHLDRRHQVAARQ